MKDKILILIIGILIGTIITTAFFYFTDSSDKRMDEKMPTDFREKPFDRELNNNIPPEIPKEDQNINENSV